MNEKIRDIVTYKACIKVEKELQLIAVHIQSFKMSDGCIHYTSSHERRELDKAQDILMEFAHKYAELVAAEEL